MKLTEMSFMPIGKRSPLLTVYNRNLRIAFYFTNAAIFLVIVLVFGYVKYHEWKYGQMIKKLGSTMGKKVITLTYAQLGPPPSLLGEGGSAPEAASGARPAAPTVGVPKPVPDAEAVAETSPTSAEISGVSPVTGAGTGTGTGTIIKVEEIPDINAFVPYEVEPRMVYSPPLNYPEIARLTDQEGTVFVKALVDLDGSIMRVVITRSSGYPTLDSAAVENVVQWRLTPALQNKKPVRVWVGRPIRFQLGK